MTVAKALTELLWVGFKISIKYLPLVLPRFIGNALLCLRVEMPSGPQLFLWSGENQPIGLRYAPFCWLEMFFRPLSHVRVTGEYGRGIQYTARTRVTNCDVTLMYA